MVVNIYINDTLRTIAKKYTMTGVVSAKGLTANPDHLHFNAKSLREFGVRYYKKFLETEDKNKKYIDKQYNDIHTDMENL